LETNPRTLQLVPEEQHATGYWALQQVVPGAQHPEEERLQHVTLKAETGDEMSPMERLYALTQVYNK
jgi:hypothetical protein